MLLERDDRLARGLREASRDKYARPLGSSKWHFGIFSAGGDEGHLIELLVVLWMLGLTLDGGGGGCYCLWRGEVPVCR